jgi:hypothetical protein
MNLETKKLQEEIMVAIPKKFTPSMNISLATPIVEGELQVVVRAMDKGKAPSPNGIVVEFFVKFWHIIGGRLPWYDCKVHQRQKIPEKSYKNVDNLIV